MNLTISSLYLLLLGFIFLNLLLNIFLYAIAKNEKIILIIKYWSLVLISYLVCFSAQSPLAISLCFAIHYFPIHYQSAYTLSTMNKKIQMKYTLPLHLAGILLSYYLYTENYSFTAYTLPLSITAFSSGFYAMYFIARNFSTSKIYHRIMFFILGYGLLNCISFAMFRMVEGTQYLGWIFAIFAYIAMALVNNFIFIQEIKELKEEVDKSHKETDAILKILIHDLKNDLFIIEHGLNKALKKDDPSFLPKVYDKTLKIINYSKEIQQLKLLKKNINTDFDFCDLIEVIQEELIGYRQLANAKNININFKKLIHNYDLNSSECIINFSKNKFATSILGNLLSNAIKFSHENATIDVEVSEHNNFYMLSVTDYGLGMDNKKLATLFNVDFNKSTLGTIGEVGSGFGLPILKQLLEIYGAKVEVFSAVDRGSKFVIYFKKQSPLKLMTNLKTKTQTYTNHLSH